MHRVILMDNFFSIVSAETTNVKERLMVLVKQQGGLKTLLICEKNRPFLQQLAIYSSHIPLLQCITLFSHI